jgi:ribosome-associated toxin RatA of RatAB toxin-antitoxin module
MGLSAVTEKIEVGAPADKVFQFVTDTDRVPRALPRAFRARVAHRSARHLGPGATAVVALRLLGLELRAELAVTAWGTNRHVGYAWRSGPFRPWEHDVWFEPLSATRCRVTHCLIYRPPAGALGAALDLLWFRGAVRRALRRLGPAWEAGALEAAAEPPSPGLSEA